VAPVGQGKGGESGATVRCDQDSTMTLALIQSGGDEGVVRDKCHVIGMLESIFFLAYTRTIAEEQLP